MYEQFSFALVITGPIVIILALGLLFRRINLIDDHFIQVGNKIVFNVTLPCMLFFGVISQPIGLSMDSPLIAFASVFTIAVVGFLSLVTPFFIREDKRGVFIQGAFRGNMGIIGIALVLNAYGPEILPKTSIYLAMLTILYNLLSVLVLRSNTQSTFFALLKNPLIIAVLLGLTCSWFGVTLPGFVHKTGQYFAQMTLPLALTCIGGSLRWDSFRANHQDVIWASMVKLLFIPMALAGIAIAWGFRGQELGLLYMMMAAPTASASYVMAQQMSRHGAMAAEIIAMTTIGSFLTITVGITALKYGGYI